MKEDTQRDIAVAGASVGIAVSVNYQMLTNNDTASYELSTNAIGVAAAILIPAAYVGMVWIFAVRVRRRLTVRNAATTSTRVSATEATATRVSTCAS